jgi:hypothetical protein
VTDAEDSVAGVGGYLSGTVGSVVYSHNRHGAYHYEKPVRADPNTPRQQAVRNTLLISNLYWRSIPESWRVGWQTYADNVPRTSRVGSSRPVSGRSEFLASSMVRGSHGSLFPPAPPQTYTRSRLGFPIFQPYLGVYVLVYYPLDDPWRTQDLGGWVLYSSKPCTQAVWHYSGPWRRCGAANGSSTTPPTSGFFAPAWLPGGSTRVIFFRFRAIEADNRLTPVLTHRLDFT